MTVRYHELISVVIPAYNAEKTLAKAVESVFAQTYQNFELIIINDCSLDNTLALAGQYAQQDIRVRVFENAQNSGVSITRRKGVDAANGEWIAFLDSDDAWVSNKLEKQLELQRRSGAKLIFTGSAFMDTEGNLLDWTLHVPPQIKYRKLLKQNLISNSSVLILKECYQKHSMTDNGMHEDFTCWLNLLKTGETAYGIDEPLLIYRLSKTSKSGNKLRAAKMNWNTYRAIGLNVFMSTYYQFHYIIHGLFKYWNLS